MLMFVCVCELFTAGDCNLHHPLSVITAVCGSLNQYTHSLFAPFLYISPFHTFTHTPLVFLSHCLCDYCHLVCGSYQCCDGSSCQGHTKTLWPSISLSVAFSSFLFFLLLCQLYSVLHLAAMERLSCGIASVLTEPHHVPVQEIGIKARHELIVPAGQTAHYNAQQGPTAGVNGTQYLLIIYSSSLDVSLGPSFSHSQAFVSIFFSIFVFSFSLSLLFPIIFSFPFHFMFLYLCFLSFSVLFPSAFHIFPFSLFYFPFLFITCFCLLSSSLFLICLLHFCSCSTSPCISASSLFLSSFITCLSLLCIFSSSLHLFILSVCPRPLAPSLSLCLFFNFSPIHTKSDPHAHSVSLFVLCHPPFSF